MDEKERLKKEVVELLTGEKPATVLQKEIIYDKNAKQFVIKIPQTIGLAAGLDTNKKIRVVINPREKEFEESQGSHFIIYGQ